MAKDGFEFRGTNVEMFWNLKEGTYTCETIEGKRSVNFEELKFDPTNLHMAREQIRTSLRNGTGVMEDASDLLAERFYTQTQEMAVAGKQVGRIIYNATCGQIA